MNSPKLQKRLLILGIVVLGVLVAVECAVIGLMLPLL